MESYKYQSLPNNEIHIRLVQLDKIREDTGQPVTCTITSCPLSQCPAYDAVSYYWGDPLDQRQVLCDGKVIRVPSNLYDFLLRNRLKPIYKPFWIDSICINQSDNDEKASQVAEMRNIYAKASRTLVWLGTEAEHSTVGLKFAARLSVALSDLDPNSKTKRSLWFRLRRYSELSAVFSDNWFAFFKLLDRAWFIRAWIVQEIALSKNTWVICGPAVISWSELYRALFYIIQHQVWIFEFYGSPNLEVLLALQSSQFEIEQGAKRVYWQVLTRHRKALASNPRDHVFAYYGLSSHDSFKEHLIVPDYGKSTKKIYTGIAISALGKASNLDFLSIPRLTRDTGKSWGLPSWVPDWSCSGGHCNSFLLFELLQTGGDFKLPYSATKDSTCTPIIHEELGQLELSGYIVDRLERVSSHWELQDTSGYQSLRKQAQVLQRNQAFIHEWESTIRVRAEPDTPYPTGETLEEALWQTLVAGLAVNNKDQIRPLYYKFRSRQCYLLWIQRLGYAESLWPWIIVVILGHILRFFGIPNPEMRFRAMTGTMINRRIVRTEKGYIGLMPRLCEEGDYVVLFKGGKLPFVVRAREKGLWEFVGDAYVHGITTGELWEEPESPREGKCSSFRLC